VLFRSQVAANGMTASWVIAQVQAGKAPTEEETREYLAARVAELEAK
jgi:hypothetical protein